MQKEWKICQAADAHAAEALRQSLLINPQLCQLLVQRNITSYDAAKYFFRPDLKNLHSPWLMKDMATAVERIDTAIRSNEKILVLGDYDVDGTTAVSCVFDFLTNNNVAAKFYLPNRFTEGYGLSKKGIEFAHTNNISLIITLDCGIKSKELVAYAKELKIDIIICDHHLPDEDLPAAYAILNPKQQNCPYPYKDLCGCGIGLKLIIALSEKWNLPSNVYHQYLDLVATAIAADIVPMTGENRILAYHGLLKANQNPNQGIKALCQLTGTKSPLHINNLVFIIAPRVNAAGRMDQADKVVKLFTAKDFHTAKEFAEQLDADNSERKEADINITENALAILAADPLTIKKRSTVLYNENWHKGVVGIVASRVIEKYYKPTIILTRSGDVATGSARSVPGYNVYAAIDNCKDFLTNYGGHYAAAGVTLPIDKVEAFKLKFENEVASTIPESCLIPTISIDMEIPFNIISFGFHNIITQMEPFGPENLRPVFCSRKVMDTGLATVLKDKHIKANFRQGNNILPAIGFNMAELQPLVRAGAVDIVYTIDTSEWNNEKTLQLKLIDIRSSS